MSLIDINLNRQALTDLYFPLEVSADGRYLQTPGGHPWPLWGDTGWELFNELTLTQVRQYLDDRAARKINTIICQATNPVRYVAASVAPTTVGASGALPFKNSSGGTWDGDPTFRDNVVNGVASGSATGNFDADFSRPVDAYWDWVDTVIREAALRNIVLVIDPMYMGFDGGSNDGWWRTLSNTQNTQSVCFNFGVYLGNRWRHHSNLILSMGTDMFPVSGSEASARFGKIFDGLTSAGCTQLTLAHYQRSSDSRDYADYLSHITLNGVYPGSFNGGSYAPVVARCRTAYAKSPAMPAVAIECNYEPDRNRQQLRYHAWGAFLSTGGGYAGFGNDTVWTFDTGWESSLNSNSIQDVTRLAKFFNDLQWWLLVPHGLGSIGTLVTSGLGTLQTLSASPGINDGTDGLDYVTASATPSGSLLVAYIPEAHSGSVTIDMTKLRGSATASWYDPSDGSTTAIGSIANTGTHAFTTPGANAGGDHDWVLRLVA